ncbi:MAG: protein jag [Clostridia bacterium]|nr:protein jag [Clostridia bacterium]
MIKEYFFTGKTIDEAVANGAKELGLDVDAGINYEVEEFPSSKLLGLIKTEAKVKILVEAPDPKPEKKFTLADEKIAPKGQKKEEKPAKVSKPLPKQNFTLADEKISEKKVAAKPEKVKEEPAPKPKRESKPVSPEALEKGAEVAVKFVKEVFDVMGVEANITSDTENNSVNLLLEGEGMGLVIGRRGETLDSLQYLTSLVVNKGKGGYIKVTLDTENYRSKREKTLIDLAHNKAQRVLKTHKSITLDAMNPYERRIIHSALQDTANITTSSIGAEPNRRVVIRYER